MKLHFQGSTRNACPGCLWPAVCGSDQTCWKREAEEEDRLRRVARSTSRFFVRTGGTASDPIGYIDTRKMELACSAAERKNGAPSLREDARRRKDRRDAETSVEQLLAGAVIEISALMNVKRFRDLEDRLNHGARIEIGADGSVRLLGTVNSAA